MTTRTSDLYMGSRKAPHATARARDGGGDGGGGDGGSGSGSNGGSTAAVVAVVAMVAMVAAVVAARRRRWGQPVAAYKRHVAVRACRTGKMAGACVVRAEGQAHTLLHGRRF